MKPQEQARINKINLELEELRDAGVSRKQISDGYHTFEELYYHRMVLFSIICNQNKDIAWKSKLHDDGTMFDDDSFIVGIETPEGQYTYHYKLDCWDNFDVKVLDYAPEFDGHDPSDIGRLYSLLEEDKVMTEEEDVFLKDLEESLNDFLFGESEEVAQEEGEGYRYSVNLFGQSDEEG